LELLNRATTRLKEKVTRLAFEDVPTPNLHTISRIASKVYLSGSDALSDLMPPYHIQVEQIQNEYGELKRELEHRYERNQLAYPLKYALEESSSLLVYGITRMVRPSVVLETGVANGHSTFLILNALIKNGGGQLHSVDISDNVGCLLSETERKVWSLNVIKEPKKQGFCEVLNRIPPVDFFVHDSNHRYAWQKFEYESILPRMADKSILASDDVDSSFAFIAFATRHRQRPSFLLDRRKVFGYLEVQR
jgi:predicted O-methyltransferase YrrM